MGLYMGLVMFKHFDNGVRKPYNAVTCYLHFYGPKVEQKKLTLSKMLQMFFSFCFFFDKEKLFHRKFGFFIEKIYCSYI